MGSYRPFANGPVICLIMIGGVFRSLTYSDTLHNNVYAYTYILHIYTKRDASFRHNINKPLTIFWTRDS